MIQQLTASTGQAQLEARKDIARVQLTRSGVEHRSGGRAGVEENKFSRRHGKMIADHRAPRSLSRGIPPAAATAADSKTRHSPKRQVDSTPDGVIRQVSTRSAGRIDRLKEGSPHQATDIRQADFSRIRAPRPSPWTNLKRGDLWTSTRKGCSDTTQERQDRERAEAQQAIRDHKDVIRVTTSELQQRPGQCHQRPRPTTSLAETRQTVSRKVRSATNCRRCNTSAEEGTPSSYQMTPLELHVADM